MSQQLSVIEQVMLKGNLSVLTPQQKIEYYAKTCESLGLNPMTKPFEYLTLNGKEVLYATKGCTEQLRNVHGVSIKIVDKQKIEDVFIVTAEASDKNGRYDSATGAVNVAGLKGEQLANAMMKAETKAKRRVTLSLCGLNMLDESEVDSIPNAKKAVTNIQNMNPVQVTSKPEQYQPKPSVQEIPDFMKEEVPLPNGDDLPQSMNQFDNGIEGGFGIQYNPEYRIPMGTDKGKTLEELGVGKVKGRKKYFEEQALAKNEMLKGNALEFCQMAEVFLQMHNAL
jgi:hypothetical protein